MLDIIARARITKVDAKQRLVYGRATQEVVDKSGEIFDYDRSKPHFEKWSNDAATATKAAGQEESLGNVRAMHKDVAAGKLTEIVFDDVEKAIDVCAKIVDDDEWKKVEEGVYTGFSIGGKYADRWPDPANAKLKRFEAIPAEISIVDNPCVPTATFEMIKADGAIELRKFTSTEQPAGDAPAGDAAKVAAVPAATETAVSNDAAKAGPASPVSAPPAAAPGAVSLKKDMYDVSVLAGLLSSVRSLAQYAQWEADMESDQSPIPAQLREWLATGAKLLVAMTTEEVAELVASVDPEAAAVMALSAKAPLVKAEGSEGSQGATVVNPAQSIHDMTVGMGASCGSGATGKAAASIDLTKAEPFVKLQAERDELQKRAESLEKRVQELEAMAAPPKGATKAVAIDKTKDTADATPDPIEEAKKSGDPLTLMKATHAAGGKRLGFA